MEDTKRNTKKNAAWDEAGVQAGSFEALRGIIAALRSEDGCPWDRVQTFESLKPCMIDEAVEALAAMDVYARSGDAENLCEELGDVLLQVVLLSQIAQDGGLFTIEDVIRGISRKMVRRHPHVFGEEASAKCMPEGEPLPGADSEGRWAAIKRAEKRGRTPEQERLQKDACRAASEWAAKYLGG